MKEKYRKRLVAKQRMRARQPKGIVKVRGVHAGGKAEKGWGGQRVDAPPKNLITYINCW